MYMYVKYNLHNVCVGVRAYACVLVCTIALPADQTFNNLSQDTLQNWRAQNDDM